MPTATFLCRKDALTKSHHQNTINIWTWGMQFQTHDTDASVMFLNFPGPSSESLRNFYLLYMIESQVFFSSNRRWTNTIVTWLYTFHIHLYTHSHTHTHTCNHTWTHAPMHPHTCMYATTHKHMHACVRAHTHICLSSDHLQIIQSRQSLETRIWITVTL